MKGRIKIPGRFKTEIMRLMDSLVAPNGSIIHGSAGTTNISDKKLEIPIIEIVKRARVFFIKRPTFTRERLNPYY